MYLSFSPLPLAVILSSAISKAPTLAPWKESYDKSIQHIKKQRHHFAHKGLYSQSYSMDVRIGP